LTPNTRATINALFGILDDRDFVTALKAAVAGGPDVLTGEQDGDEGR
jgi:hypothetical protein